MLARILNSMLFNARLFREGDEEEIIKLLTTIFNGWPHFDLNCSALEHWRWKYLYNNFTKSIVIVAEKDDMIVGCHHSGFLRIKIGNNVFLCAQAMDFGTHPQFRKMGVSNSINNLNKEINEIGGNPAILSYWATANPLVIQINKRAGYPSFPKPLSYLVRIKDVSKQLEIMQVKNKLMTKTGFNVLKLINKLRVLNKKRIDKEINISSINKFDDKFDNFWNNIKDEYDFIIERSKEYLNWKYADSRGGNYRITIAHEEDEVLGYLVSKNKQIQDKLP